MKSLALALAACFVGVALVSTPDARAGSSNQIDVELVFDTSGSMESAIEQAKRDGRMIVAEVKRFVPDARFAVVSFRDYQNPAGEYETVQGFTDDGAKVEAALEKLQSRKNPLPTNVEVELHNLALHRSYSDATLGWRANSRKLVILVSDAEPYGGGTERLEGCQDVRPDPKGFETHAELDAMRAAKRTLILIRQRTGSTDAPLRCYASLAARAYPGGSARDSGSADLGRVVVDLVRRAYAPVSIRPDLTIARPGGSLGYTLSLRNPNAFGVRLATLSATLPGGFRYRASTTGITRARPAVAGRTLTWRLGRTLRPAESVSLHFVARVPRGSGPKMAVGVARIELPGGESIAGTTRSIAVRVTPRPRLLSLALRSFASRGPLGSARIRGTATIRFAPGARRPFEPAGLPAGSFTVAYGRGRSLELRVRTHRIVRFGAPTLVALGVEVERSRGLGRCARGTRGSIVLADSARLLGSGRDADSASLRLAAGCRAGGYRWSNDSAGGGWANVSVSGR